MYMCMWSKHMYIEKMAVEVGARLAASEPR